MKAIIFTIICGLIFNHIFCQPISYKHFTLHPLAKGVYAAIANTNGLSICNAGIIDLGETALIIDPFMAPAAAEELKSVAEKITGHTRHCVINTHYHTDHVLGNRIFKNDTIFSTETTLSLINASQSEEISNLEKSIDEILQQLAKEYSSSTNEFELEEKAKWVSYYRALKDAANQWYPVYPNFTIEKEFKLKGRAREVQLISYGSGHTQSDLFVYLPQEKIIFMGDLLFIDNHAWLGDGDVPHWKTYLDSITILQPEILVPGHGPIGSMKDIGVMKDYLDLISLQAGILTQKTKYSTLEAVSLKDLPAPFNSWHLTRFYGLNIILLSKKMETGSQ